MRNLLKVKKTVDDNWIKVCGLLEKDYSYYVTYYTRMRIPNVEVSEEISDNEIDNIKKYEEALKFNNYDDAFNFYESNCKL